MRDSLTHCRAVWIDNAAAVAAAVVVAAAAVNTSSGT